MDKIQSSFTFLVLFLMECPLLLCLPYGGEFQPAELATDCYKQSQTSTNVTKQEGVFSRLREQPEFYSTFNTHEHRHLECSRLVQAEERQQLVWLYNNVRIPFLGDDVNDQDSEEDSLDESTCLLPENEKELEKFIHSVIRSKRRKHMENRSLKKEQILLTEAKIGNSMDSIFSEDL
ncbi:uncharacterized protein C19orf18 homolog [Ursus americanus]|uniref:uncharacterized protein C19orf18 homolog n=1 Tax=Ursus americanus TaxID=9643 RepID=UPI001E67ADCC|nr:uncharacterized protein C19orf18 homolog [Ursus americanus]